MADVFLSHLEETEGAADALLGYLSRARPDLTFFRTRHRAIPEDYPQTVAKELQGCSVMVFLVGPQWITAVREGDATSVGAALRLEVDQARLHRALKTVVFYAEPIKPRMDLPREVLWLALPYGWRRWSAIPTRGEILRAAVDLLLGFFPSDPTQPSPRKWSGEEGVRRLEEQRLRSEEAERHRAETEKERVEAEAALATAASRHAVQEEARRRASEASEAARSREVERRAAEESVRREETETILLPKSTLPPTKAPAAPPPVLAPRPASKLGIFARLAGVFRRKPKVVLRYEEATETAPEVLSEATSETVACTVFAPPEVADSAVLIQVFVHQPADEDHVRSLAGTYDSEAVPRGKSLLDRQLTRGTELTFQLVMPGATVEDPVQRVRWQGTADSVQFGVSVPRHARSRNLIGTVTVSEGSIPIGRVKFVLRVVPAHAAAPSKHQVVDQSWTRYRHAFISYASQDRAEVLKRVQMLERVKIDYFADLLSLDPGERWAKALYTNIDSSDVFFLFWSSAAKNSEWVMKEVRYAIERHAGDETAPPEIIPVLIEGPPPVPPPPELKELHFNDQFLYFIAGSA